MHAKRVGCRRQDALVLLLLVSCLLASCTFPGSTQPTFKISLIAPFEGHDRSIGYDAIYAARLAVRQANQASGGVGGYRVELIAYDDGGEDETAAQQVDMLALDPAVLGVIGPLRDEATQAAAARLACQQAARLGLPLLVPAEDAPSTEQFIADYVAVSGGTPPGPYAWATFHAVQVLLEAARRDIQSSGAPTRAGVEKQLQAMHPGEPGPQAPVYLPGFRPN